MGVTTASGTRIYIGPAAADSVDQISEFAALTPYVEIGLVEDLGEFGDQASTVSFSAIGDARVRKSKGARDAGEMSVTCGFDNLDPGQLACEAAQMTKSSYAIKIVFPDRSVPGNTDTVSYCRAKVNSVRKRVGTNDNVIRRMITLAIDSPIYETPAT